jgi:hypothetical protein
MKSSQKIGGWLSGAVRSCSYNRNKILLFQPIKWGKIEKSATGTYYKRKVPHLFFFQGKSNEFFHAFSRQRWKIDWQEQCLDLFFYFLYL